MSRFTKACLWSAVSLGLLAASGAARAQGPCQVDVGFHCNIVNAGARATLGPWYAYFPYEAHFQLPAPWGMYPNWPAPFPPPGTVAPAPPRAPTPVLPPAQGGGALPPIPQAQRPLIQPVGYGYQVPSYWYGR